MFSKSHFKFAAELSWLSTLFFVLKRTIRFCQFLNQTSSGYFSPGYLSFASTFRYELTFQTFTWVEKIYFKFLMRKLNESLFATDQATLTRIQAVSYSHALSLSLSLSHTHTSKHSHTQRRPLSCTNLNLLPFSRNISYTNSRILSFSFALSPITYDAVLCLIWRFAGLRLLTLIKEWSGAFEILKCQFAKDQSP